MFAPTTPPLLGNVRQLPAMDAHELLRCSCKFDLPFTLEQLRILKAIAAEGSFTRATDRLYVSQPAITIQVQNLERQLNVPLFDRVGRRAN